MGFTARGISICFKGKAGIDLRRFAECEFVTCFMRGWGEHFGIVDSEF